jgi:NAD(P)-dependent dehydrogenase (short-subunit alcohol dehydrogenase family)
MGLNGRVALVTGAARGLGKTVATTLGRKGCKVVLADILDDVEKSAAELKSEGITTSSVKMDISNYQQVVEGFAKAKADLGDIDILINNAAITGSFATAGKLPPEVWDKEIAVDLSGAFYCSRQVIQSMVERKWGRIVNVISPAGMHGGYGQCSYSASKCGLIGLARSIALETARYGVTANCVMPGLMPTPGYYTLKEDVRERLLKKIASRKLCEPQYVADMIAFLCSDEASYFTGEVYSAAGGDELQIY